MPTSVHRALAAAVLLAVACSPAEQADERPGERLDELSVAVASFDISVGEDQRLLAGIFTPERELLAFGEVVFQLGPVAEDGSVEVVEQATASWLPVPGMEPSGATERPRFLIGEVGTGVYAAQVDLDRPGVWGLRVLVETEDGDQLQGQTIVNVQPEPLVPDVGDAAPRVANHTVADVEAGHVPPTAVDSRAVEGPIPDPHLHDVSIPDALDAGRPLVVAITTPVYCVSRFCGPLTEVIAELAHEHDHVDFVHVEVWEDFGEQRLNEAAAAWIQHEQGGNEPWVFLVDGDGTIVARWDNVLDVGQLQRALASM